jgi:hypothetical protein
MNMAKFLKRSANLFMGITMFKLVAEDLGTEVRRSPYGSAGAAVALGLAAGMVIGWRQRHRQVS